MAFFSLIIDSQPPYLRRARNASLLLAPLGTGTVLSCLARRSLEAGCEVVMIIPALETWEGYEKQCLEAAQASVSVAPSGALKAVLASFETSDSLVLLDPRWFLAESVDLVGMLRDGQHHRWV